MQYERKKKINAIQGFTMFWLNHLIQITRMQGSSIQNVLRLDAVNFFRLDKFSLGKAMKDR